MTRIAVRKTRSGSRMLLAALSVLLLGSLSTMGQAGASNAKELYLGGQPGASIRMDVFSDYQCPACRAFYLETLKPLIAAYTNENKIDKICVVYHDFPLEMHPYARKAARFALAAYRLGRERWLRVTDALYEEQVQWSQDGNIESALAKALSPVELSRVARMAADPDIDAAVAQEIVAAQVRNVTSTPTLFIHGANGTQQRVNGGVPLPVLKDFLDRQMK